MASNGGNSRGILGWLVLLMVIIGLAAAFFAFNLDELAKYEYYKLTYKVSDDPSAKDFSGFYSKKSGSISVSMDIRAFTLYAFLEGVAGYEDEYGVTKSKERQQLDGDMESRLAAVPASRIKRWKDFYDKHPYNVYSYLHYVLALGRPPEFEYIIPKADIDEKDFFMLGGFNKVLKDFYEILKIDELYAWHKSAGFFKVVDSYDLAKLLEQQKFVHKYLRIDSSKTSQMSLTVIPMPYESHYVAYSVTYGHLAYLIDGPDASDGNLNWHEYLHVFISPAVKNTIWAYQSKFNDIFERNRQKEFVKGSYERLDSFVAECIIRALDHKIQVAYAPSWAKDSLQKKLNDMEKTEILNGFALIPYFSQELSKFETEGAIDITSFVKKTLSDYTN